MLTKLRGTENVFLNKIWGRMLFLENGLERQTEKLQVSAQRHQESPGTRPSHPRARPTPTAREEPASACPVATGTKLPAAAAGSWAAAPVSTRTDSTAPLGRTLPPRCPSSPGDRCPAATARPSSGSAHPAATGPSQGLPRACIRVINHVHSVMWGQGRSRWKPLAGCCSMER